MANTGSQKALGATDSGLRLAEHPLGSERSRAAARALLNARKASQGEGILMVLKLVGRPEKPGQRCTCPKPEFGTVALCRCFT